MILWFEHFACLLMETAQNLLPIMTLIIGFQLGVIRKPLPNPLKIFIGFVYITIGIAFFMEGLNMALFPLGDLMAKQLTAPAFLGISAQATHIPWQKYGWVYIFAASLGFATTLAEPSLLAIAKKAEVISGGTIHALGLRLAVACGVAFGLALGTFKIITGTPLYHYMMTGYVIILIQTFFASKNVIGLAYDSGGVTVSTVTIPLVTALGIGLASNVPGRNPLIDGFSLIAFACLFPVIAVLTYAQIVSWLTKRTPLS
jgi:Protein of unknown function (DUF1538)